MKKIILMLLVFLAPLCFAASQCGTAFDQCQISCCTSTGNTPTGSFAADDYLCNTKSSLKSYDLCVSNTCTPSYLSCTDTSADCMAQQQSCVQSCDASSDEYCYETCDNFAIDGCVDGNGSTPPVTSSSSCCGSLIAILFVGIGAFFVSRK